MDDDPQHGRLADAVEALHPGVGPAAVNHASGDFAALGDVWFRAAATDAVLNASGSKTRGRTLRTGVKISVRSSTPDGSREY